MSSSIESPGKTQAEFLNGVEQAFSASNRDFARAYYLFATARLNHTYNSEEIHARYPVLSRGETLQRLRGILDGQPDDETVKRLFISVVHAYIDAQLAKDADAFQNLKYALQVDVRDLGLTDPTGASIQELLYEDVAGWLKKTPDKALRQALYERMAAAWTQSLAPRFIELFRKENALMAELGYGDVIAFHSWATGHDLKALGHQAEKLLEDTEADYQRLMSAYYHQRTGLDWDKDATRADISFVLHGPSDEMAEIDARFPSSRLLSLARRTFDGLGLRFSALATEVDFAERADFEREVVKKTEDSIRRGEPMQRILLDVAHRAGKPSRAYVYPAVVPGEIYLSVKPEGGLDDYLAFFHEAGHAQHFAYESPALGFAEALLGNNTVTESYAYLFQNLFLNRHWLEKTAGLSSADARRVVARRALEDLYMLRRYASKMQFELELFDGVNASGFTLADKGAIYSRLLTRGGGFRYDAEGWTRDVDARFYVADYFTAWSLEAQLRETLCKRFGTGAADGEDWYENPKAGEFLKSLWAEGNLSQQALSDRLGYKNPVDLSPLLYFMQTNLSA